MAKMSELDRCIKELRTAAESLTNAADSLTDFYNEKPPEVEESEHIELAEPQTAPPAPETAEITKEELRGIIAAKAESGFRTEVKVLLKKYGSGNLTSVPPENYAALKADAEALS